MARTYSRNPNANRERAMVLGVIGLLALGVLVLRLFTLQVVLGAKYQEYSEKNWLRPKRIPGRRGRILDRNGAVLADIIPSYSVLFDAQHEAFSKDKSLRAGILQRVGDLTGSDPAVFLKTLEETKAYSYEPVVLLRQVDLTTVTILEERRYELPGISVNTVPTRYYPQDSLAAHVLGYVQEVTPRDLESNPTAYRLGSMIGRTGIEASFETHLRGKDGVRFIEVSAVGRRSESFLTLAPIPPQTGSDLTLALDAGLQRVAEQALETAPFNGEGEAPSEVKGAVVVIDVRNGDVLAMASLPTYDPNAFSRRLSQAEWDRMNRSSQPLFHRALRGMYPPGSTFKGLTLYGALEKRLITPTQRLAPCDGGWQYGNRYFRCWKSGGHGSLNAVEALAQSCDAFFYQIAPQLGLEGFEKLGHRFRVAEKTGIQLAGEHPGMIPTRDWFNRTYGSRGWSKGVTLNLGIGQGEVSLSPLQLAVYTGTIATGRRVAPRLVIGEAGVSNPPSRGVDLGLDPGYLAVVRRGMESAVQRGTAQVVRFESLRVAAKTGTAENAGLDHAVFIAYAPADNPEVALAVYLENRGHGGAAAGPVARKLLSQYFGLGNVGSGALAEGD